MSSGTAEPLAVSHPMRPTKTPSKYLFLSLASLVSALFALLFADQVLFRFLNAFSAPIKGAKSAPLAERLTVSTYHPILGYAGIPNVKERVIGTQIEQNSAGNRGPEYDCLQEGSPVKIIVSGDSFAWGYGLEEDQTVSAILARQYQASTGVAAAVLNFGVSGYGPDQSFLKYLLYGRECHPKFVALLLYTGNDVDETNATQAWGAEKPRFFYNGSQLCLTNIPPPRAKGWPHADIRSSLFQKFPWLKGELVLGPVSFSLQHSQILEYLSRREFLLTLGGRSAGLERVKDGERVRSEIQCYEDTPSAEDFRRLGPFALVARIVWRFSKAVEADGGRFRVVLIPNETEQETGVVQAGHARLLQLLREYKIPVSDLSDVQGVPLEMVMAKRPAAWRPDGHFSALGSEIVAARILHDARRDGQL